MGTLFKNLKKIINMKTYFLFNRKEKDWQQLTRQIRMFLVRKKIDLNSKVLIEISDAKLETKFNTVKITIT